ncbi:MAG: TylF/MycF/NovP-related O-methyltransferase [Spirochaetota bacterium]
MTRQGESSDAKYTAPGYARVEPRATYAPWTEDQKFLEVNEMIREHTLVDRYRCFELWQLVDQAMKSGGDLLEVGVWRGGTGALIAARARQLHLRALDQGRDDQPRRVFLADTFSGVVKAGPLDRYYRGGEHGNTSVDQVRTLLASLELHDVEILQGVFPEDTAARIGENRFCFCHIDVDVYKGARDVTDWVLPRMAPGAIVVYDDYGFYGCEGVTTFVHEIWERDDLAIIHNLNGHAIAVKTG